MRPLMQLVEQHRIDRHDPRFAAIDTAAFASKNLYNAANYLVRQSFILANKYLNYHEMHQRMKHTPEYKALPAKVAQWVLKQLDHNWKSFFAAIQVWRDDPSHFRGRPKPPRYLNKQGRNLLIYTLQAISRVGVRTGLIQPSGISIEVKTQHKDIQQVRIVPKVTHYVVEVIYEQSVVLKSLDQTLVAGIDIGLDNLAALTSNKPGFVPILINGRPLKAINQFYNKRKAHLQSKLIDRYTSRQLEQLIDKRNRRVSNYLHCASRMIINRLVQDGIGTLILGKNHGWKQRINLGKRTNQQFVAVPHTRFVDMLRYKAELAGIMVIITEESYTSKCSFLDAEPIDKADTYEGKRIKRGMFRSASGKLINADCNGSYNIIRKVVPNAFGNGIASVVVHPTRIALTNRSVA
jgi:putative transposase